jgi:hypothetical protein
LHGYRQLERKIGRLTFALQSHFCGRMIPFRIAANPERGTRVAAGFLKPEK